MQPSTTAILNLATIHAAVVKMMEPHSAKIEQRRNAIASLRQGLAQQNAQLLPMLRSRKAWFSTTQTAASNPKLCIRACLKIGVCRIDVRNPLGRVKLAMKKARE